MTLATAPRRAARRMSSEDTLALWREYRARTIVRCVTAWS